VRELAWKGRARLRKKYSHAFPLSESQIEILESLAKLAPTNAYQIQKDTGKAYSFVYNTLKELEGRKMIHLTRKEHTEKGTTANIYDLNLESVLFILQRQQRSSNYDFSQSRDILEKYSDLLPLVFGKWKYFESKVKGKVKEIAKHRFKVLVDSYVSNPLSFKKGTSSYPGIDAKNIATWFFYFQFNHFKFSKPWMEALKDDEEIKYYVIKELKDYQKFLDKIDNIIEENITFLETEK
jgi:DNA-binding transcriptional ArsR family regulator